MHRISVVIIAKNEAGNIAECVTSAKKISSNILVADSGSSDNTINIAQQNGAIVLKIQWQGYGDARNIAAEAATHDWILALDADERVTDEMVTCLLNQKALNLNLIYGFKRQNFFLGKKIRFGKWGRDVVFRLYNKKKVKWNLSKVHEVLVGENISKLSLNCMINHFPVKNLNQNYEKMFRYAELNAAHYNSIGKKATFIKRYLSPLFDFVQSYFLFLGFLDGKEGFIISYSNARYTWLKYKYLHSSQSYKKLDHD